MFFEIDFKEIKLNFMCFIVKIYTIKIKNPIDFWKINNKFRLFNTYD